jgi:hypothetical protein
MESSLDCHKDLMLRQHLKELRAKEPEATFSQLWERLKKQRPFLFQAEEEFGQVRQPAIKLGVQTKGSLSEVQPADHISVRSEDIRLERIEAAWR